MDRNAAEQIIQSREFIASPCASVLKCTNVTFYEGKFIANFAAMTPYLVEKAITIMDATPDDGDFQAATNTSLSASLRPTDFIPSKGEMVKVVVSEVTTNNGVTGLFVTNVSELKAVKTSKVSLKPQASESFSKIEDTTLVNA